MTLFRLLMRESSLSPWLVLFVASVSGISNALILTLVNTATQQSSEKASLFYISLFAIIISVYLLSQRYILTTTIKEVDAILHKFRLKIVNKIQNAELLALDQVGRSEIYSAIAKEMQTISNASTSMVLMSQSAILIVFTLVYIGWLSRLALLFFIVFLTSGVLFYILKMRTLSKDIHESITLENELFEAVTHVLDGFKEVKMSQARGAALTQHISDISSSVVDIKGNTTTQIAIVNLFAHSSFYMLTAAVVFLLPQLSSDSSDISAQLSAGVLFLTGPVGLLVGSAQLYTNANVAAETIENLEAALDQHVRPASQRKAQPLVLQQHPFGEITFEDVVFTYTAGDGQVAFQLGPINLSIACGETIFITGGNGSGKSTFMRLLTCLYFPTKGEVRVDQQRLSEANAEAYRNLFSVIFYDYHLFDRLYGLTRPDAQQVDALLEKLHLKGVTRLVDERFEPLDLSTGQKRRLALLTSYLEDKPIYVFDEWAAEQDPEFRRYFYTDILPDLKARGKTVIAVTHDDRYYDMEYVDRIIKFEEGHVVSESS